MGRYEKAVKLLKSALDKCQRTYGVSHETTVEVMIDLAIIYVWLGRYDDDAAGLETKALRIQ